MKNPLILAISCILTAAVLGGVGYWSARVLAGEGDGGRWMSESEWASYSRDLKWMPSALDGSWIDNPRFVLGAALLGIPPSYSAFSIFQADVSASRAGELRGRDEMRWLVNRANADIRHQLLVQDLRSSGPQHGGALILLGKNGGILAYGLLASTEADFTAAFRDGFTRHLEQFAPVQR